MVYRVRSKKFGKQVTVNSDRTTENSKWTLCAYIICIGESDGGFIVVAYKLLSHCSCNSFFVSSHNQSVQTTTTMSSNANNNYLDTGMNSKQATNMNVNPNNTTTVPMAMDPATSTIWQRRLQILTDDPSDPNEWWIYELLKYLRGDADALILTFDVSALWLGYSLIKTAFPTDTTFFPDIFNLIAMLPIKNDEKVEKKVMVELVLTAARECGMDWWHESRERMAVFMGIMLAGMVLRRIGKDGNVEDEKLGELMGKVDLGAVEDKDIMDRLVKEMEAELRISL